MKKRTCFFFWLLGIVSISNTYAEKTLIHGVAPDYAGRPLAASCIADGLTERHIVLATDTVSADGRFELLFDTQSTKMICLDLGHYEGRLYTEPGKTYEVELPERRDLTELERFNPYFKPKMILLSLVNPPTDDINLLIDRFDEAADSVWEVCLFGGATPDLIESGINELENRFSSDENAFFERYKRYNYAMLVNLYRKNSPALAIDNFFMRDSIDFENPAWWEAFDLVFETFSRPDVLAGNQPLADLVTINNVLRHKGDLTELTSVESDKRVRDIAQFFYKMLTAGSVGSSVGEGWINLQGDSVFAADPERRQTYIIFSNREIIECKADVTFAKTLAAKWKKRCRFVIVYANEEQIPTEKPSEYIEYLCTQHNPTILEDFGIRALPAYVILNTDGRIEQSPAPNPERYLPE
ncbi:MAG: hypothetical protein J5808_02175 [Paludibacteraceae bacterium]|nr:hypothetical protein [Paludibacteraceae bacterium]